MAFTIKKPEPFAIHGTKGDYIIPAMSQLSAADLGDVLTLTTETGAEEKIAILKAFLLRMAPGLKDEELGDFGYLQIYQAYEKEQNPGK